jgi:hypothetical protein
VTTTEQDQQEQHRERTVGITIDTKQVIAPSHVQTPRQLLALVGKNPSEDYLVLIKGKRDRESFKDCPDAKIHLHTGMTFITVSIGPMPVS